MSRTLDQVLIELNSAYIARAEMMQGKRVSKLRFASAQRTTEYEFSDIVTFEQLQEYIALLEAERDMLEDSSTKLPKFRTNENIAMTYRKGGV